MIRYKKNIIEMLKEKGLSTYIIRQHKIFTESQLQQLRTDKLVRQDILDKICTILDCQPGDLVEYVPDEKNKEFLKNTLTYIKK